MINSKLIITDMDEVLVKLNEQWLKTLNDRYGLSVREEEITSWNITKFFPSLTPDQVYQPLSEVEMWKKIEPVPGAVENLTKLHEKRNTIFVVTASHYRNIQPKIDECLLKHFPFLNYKNIVMCFHKGMLKGDYIIDDYPDNFRGSPAHRILMDKPYNQDSIFHHQRVKTWDQIYRIIEE